MAKGFGQEPFPGCAHQLLPLIHDLLNRWLLAAVGAPSRPNGVHSHAS